MTEQTFLISYKEIKFDKHNKPITHNYTKFRRTMQQAQALKNKLENDSTHDYRNVTIKPQNKFTMSVKKWSI